MHKCQTCARRNKHNPKKCDVMVEQFEGCWAYTTDKDWEQKVRKAVAEYVLRNLASVEEKL